MRTHALIAAGVAACGSAAYAGSVSIDFGDDPLSPTATHGLLAPEYAAAPYFIEFLSGAGSAPTDTQAILGAQPHELVMRAVDGYVFNDFRFAMEIDAAAQERTVTIEVTTRHAGAAIFEQITVAEIAQSGSLTSAVSSEVIQAQGWSDITQIRIIDSGGAFRVDHVSYGTGQIAPLPGPAGLAAAAGAGICGLGTLRRRRR